jgi:glutamate--cysteine ligase
MSRSIEAPDVAQQPLQPTDLAAFFARAVKPHTADHRVGTEFEKFGLARSGDRLEPVEFHRHVEPILHELVARFGWAPGPTRGAGGEYVELLRDGASITLEPGGQLELSGRPQANIHDTAQEMLAHQRELDAVSEPRGVCWITAGFHPFATRDEIHWVPKPRYAIMREYLPTRGDQALDMMLRTCTIQANFDYGSEADCGEAFRLGLALSPLVAAMFANSPHVEGRRGPTRSVRGGVWSNVDPDRCGLPRWAVTEPFSFERYAEWALDIPMFFIERDERLLPTHGTFRTFLRDGLVDASGVRHAATRGDWALHLSTLFPEVRLKPFIEVRSADAGGLAAATELPALWKGLLYDGDARATALELVGNHSYEDLQALGDEARVAGLRSPRIAAACNRLAAAASEGLERQGRRDGQGRSEAIFLEDLRKRLSQGRCPADAVLLATGDHPGRDAPGRLRLARAHWFAGAALP